jgi:8-oxo-dGTP pyrophosphatase MutT (NUDIX family)
MSISMFSLRFAGSINKSVNQNPWKTIGSRTAYENAWLRVREDQVIRPDGEPGIYGVIEIRPSVGVVALNERDEIVLVGQWRYALNRYSWEIPRGGSRPDETDMQQAAERELAEEAGVRAADWQAMGRVDVGNGVLDDVQSFYLATELSPTNTNFDAEEDITIVWKPFEQAVKMAMDGTITEVCSIAAILRVAMMRREKT